MTTFNGEKYVKQQIDSIINQLGSEDELIISDDGSTDNTINIIKQYNDCRIILLHHKKNPLFEKKHCSKNFYFATDNFENAIKHAKGDYIFLSDQDDIFMANKIYKMISALQNSDCVLCNYLVIDSDGHEKKDFSKKPMFSKSVLLNLLRTPFLGCCMAFTRNALEYIMPFPKGVFCHDLWIGSLCAYKRQLVYIDEPLHKYRVHEGNVSPSVTKKSPNSFIFKVSYRIVFLHRFVSRMLLKK